MQLADDKTLKLDDLDRQMESQETRDSASQSARTRFQISSEWSAWIVIPVFLASVLITLLSWVILPNRFRLPASEQSDYYHSYEPEARNILAGKGFSRSNENPATDYPPGYPLMLAGVFRLSAWLNISETVGLSAFAVAGMGLVSVFVFFLARTIWGPLAALFSSLLWMTYPFALWLTRQPNSEIPFMVVFYGGLFLFWYALVRKTHAWPLYFCCGLLFGSAMLIRPIAIGIGFVLALVIWIVGREMRARLRLFLILMLLLGSFVVVLPWETLVYLRTGRMILLSTNGVPSVREGLTFAVNGKDYRVQGNVSPDVAEVMNEVLARKNEMVSIGSIVSIMAHELRVHPVALTKLFLLKAARSWYGTDSLRNETPILLIQIGYFVPILWSIRKAWGRGESYRKFVVSVLLIVIYFWGMSVIALSMVRLMVPVTGLFFILIGGALSDRLLSAARYQVFCRKQ
jgi:4-amino-4-deoxy-L-arabinose transferase-like glycosyltransferase